MNWVLIGFKNSGKTTVGKLLAAKTKQTFIDVDRLIEQQYDVLMNEPLSVQSIYQKKGETYFRHLEKNVIANLALTENSIIATGGGCVLDAENSLRLKQLGKIIYLSVPLSTLIQRTQLQPPAFLQHESFEKSFIELHQTRKDLYHEAADIIFSTENKSVTEITNEIFFLMENTYAQ